MKLSYRGQSYESASNRAGTDATRLPKTKLIYRGQTYCTTRSATPEATPAAGPVVTLIYRGITYERVLRSLKPCYPSGVINWRYRTGY